MYKEPTGKDKKTADEFDNRASEVGEGLLKCLYKGDSNILGIAKKSPQITCLFVDALIIGGKGSTELSDYVVERSFINAERIHTDYVTNQARETGREEHLYYGQELQLTDYESALNTLNQDTERIAKEFPNYASLAKRLSSNALKVGEDVLDVLYGRKTLPLSSFFPIFSLLGILKDIQRTKHPQFMDAAFSFALRAAKIAHYAYRNHPKQFDVNELIGMLE